MPRIRCLYLDCMFLDDGFCGAAAIEIDPDIGCSTYKRRNDVADIEDWDDDSDDIDEWDEVDLDGEDDDLWIDDDDF